jgi:hypothetical protein
MEVRHVPDIQGSVNVLLTNVLKTKNIMLRSAPSYFYILIKTTTSHQLRNLYNI